VIGWLDEHSMQAVLCLQKEFVEHMLAKAGSRNYSKLSVITDLSFSITKIMVVSRMNFFPVPRVDSVIVYLKPKERKYTKEEIGIVNLLMQHKKKKLMNAMLDSHYYLGLDKKEIGKKLRPLESELSRRVFLLPPQELVGIAAKINSALQKE
jgi:16S rRNA (adenine1518-N6/adenine1519-N6)-dimethyltransferase